jgi:hypothetical protein
MEKEEEISGRREERGGREDVPVQGPVKLFTSSGILASGSPRVPVAHEQVLELGPVSTQTLYGIRLHAEYFGPAHRGISEKNILKNKNATRSVPVQLAFQPEVSLTSFTKTRYGTPEPEYKVPTGQEQFQISGVTLAHTEFRTPKQGLGLAQGSFGMHSTAPSPPTILKQM